MSKGDLVLWNTMKGKRLCLVVKIEHDGLGNPIALLIDQGRKISVPIGGHGHYEFDHIQSVVDKLLACNFSSSVV